MRTVPVSAFVLPLLLLTACGDDDRTIVMPAQQPAVVTAPPTTVVTPPASTVVVPQAGTTRGCPAGAVTC
jgi:hypothetical protein